MSRTGAPRPEPVTATGLRVAIIASRWHTTVMNGLLDGALRACKDSSTAEPEVIGVPGSFELPVAARAAIDAGFEAVVALGVVVRGDTPHFDYVCRGATDQLARIAVDTGVPIGFGLLTCDTEEQALARAGLPDSTEDKGYEAAAAAIEVAGTVARLAPRS
ncbi:6,7-dimethyl-8-ribityllumazine synthase [Microlunatus sp. Gsoil 973]|uniref:6,7-dimethyl-8-ribityllumazine synthase n=1 Tax=Microlunatus sp. Gsoil 973 TaxID=2672569 RepID=UPI0012B46836|nr:6,7-dimethyl-8-ribityllumazine synthase [Microlunatus sp. Gsoil 973]QGN34991.1 6,7-dimethyl-8-ribityllumazine synthase [Microlunatus sp. Gsoil 973]